MKLTALSVVILSLGVVLGLALRGVVFDAEAAKPVKPPPTGRLIELGTLSATGNQSVQFPLVDVRDCSQTSVLARTTAGGDVRFGDEDVSVSMDGTTMVGSNLFLRDIGDNGATALLGAWPFIQVGVTPGITTDVTAWIWCAP